MSSTGISKCTTCPLICRYRLSGAHATRAADRAPLRGVPGPPRRKGPYPRRVTVPAGTASTGDDRAVPRWVCPYCEREFARAHQSHVCAPGGSVDDTFAGHPPGHRAVYAAIQAHLLSLGPVHEDAVAVGVFLKRDRKLAE